MKNNIVFFAVFVFIGIIIFGGLKLQSVEDYYLPKEESAVESIFISISCKTILDNYSDLDKTLQSEKYVPSDGIILTKTEFTLIAGENVYNVLDKAIKANRIHMESQYFSIDESVYVKAINHIYQFSCGPLSGWMYKVNGQFPMFGSSQYKLKNGDYIEWLYTCDLGRDIGNNYGGQ